MGIETQAIIEILYRDKDINQAIKNIIPFDLQSDAKHELFVAIYRRESKEEGFIERGYNEKWITWYCIRTLMNFVSGSKFQKEFILKKTMPIDYDSNIISEDDYDLDKDELTEKMLKEFDQLGWMDKEIFTRYANNENISQLSIDSGIPRNTLLYIINRVKTHLKDQLHDSTNSNHNSNLPSGLREVRQLKLF